MINEKWENNFYSKGKYLNNYPFDLVVSLMAKKFFSLSPSQRKKIKVLDLGCGAGNHAKFFAENGFSAYGIDGSATAIKHCRNKFKKLGLKGEFIRGDFLHLPYPDNFFDACLDRESVYANKLADIKLTIDEVYKKLKPGGMFLSFMYSTFHPEINKAVSRVEKNTFSDFRPDGYFYNTGLVHFTTQKELLRLFRKFKIKHILRHSLTEVYGRKLMQYDEYVTIAKK